MHKLFLQVKSASFTLVPPTKTLSFTLLPPTMTAISAVILSVRRKRGLIVPQVRHCSEAY